MGEIIALTEEKRGKEAEVMPFLPPAAVLPSCDGVVERPAGEVGAKGVDGRLAAAEATCAGPALPYLPAAVLPSPIQQVGQYPTRLHLHPAGAGDCGG